MKVLRGIWNFWYAFIIGDDWRLAAGALAGLGLCSIAKQVGLEIGWWLLPLMILAALTWSLRQATSGKP